MDVSSAIGHEVRHIVAEHEAILATMPLKPKRVRSLEPD